MTGYIDLCALHACAPIDFTGPLTSRTRDGDHFVRIGGSVILARSGALSGKSIHAK
jgi:hypothetical protein